MAPTPSPPRPGIRSIGLLAVGLVVVGFGTLVPALLPGPSTASPNDPASSAGSADLFRPLVKLAVGLVVTAGACVLVARLFGRRPAMPPGGVLEVVDTLAVDPRCTVYLVRAGGRRLLIGSDGAGVKAVLELPGPGPADARQVLGPVRIPVPA